MIKKLRNNRGDGKDAVSISIIKKLRNSRGDGKDAASISTAIVAVAGSEWWDSAHVNVVPEQDIKQYDWVLNVPP